jgi:hypothetical protein
MRKGLFALCLMLLLCGCQSKTETETASVPQLNMKDTVAVQEQMSNNGWSVSDTTAASFHVWEDLKPSDMFLAEDTAGNSFIYGEFSDADSAYHAYQTTVPLTYEATQLQNTDQYYQAFVTLEDGNGYWLFRCVDASVMGVWMQDASESAELASVFDSLLENPDQIVSQTEQEETE